jgi:O-methyltransferase involved in polyketide biosynthesis
MEMPSNISATAFLSSQSRARAVEASKDTYSRLWVSSETIHLWDDFAENVYPHDDLELALRCRFFLERLQSFVEENANPIFINVAAGFTSYPFLIEPPCSCIEVDYPHVLDFKSSQLKKWQEEGVLPKRKIEFFPTDLKNTSNLGDLRKAVSSWIDEQPSYILMEGITYYLDIPILKKLLAMFRDSQVKGSLVAFDFWKPDIVHHPVFIKLEKYFAERFGFESRTYNLFDAEFISSIEGYEIVEITDVAKQEKKYCTSNVLQNYENMLVENYAVIRKI